MTLTDFARLPAGTPRRLLILGLLVIGIFLLSGCDDLDEPVARQPLVSTASNQGDYAVGYVEGDCPFFFDADVDPEVLEAISCGYMPVPQDRREPDGLQIEIAVAIIASLSDDPLPDPILYLEGGPGGGALASAESWLESPLREERQIILFDQRGTGYSWPNLGCPELDEIDDSRDRELFLEALTDCRDRLLDLGVDLADYHSAASAHDVADLRQLLEIESWNLLGISYGTRLALTVMRDRPEGVRSVVLDSVYPPNVNAYVEQALTFGGAINLLLDGCAEDPDCDAAFPDLRQTFYELLLELDAEPLYFAADEIDAEEDIEVDAYTFVNLLTDALYDTDLIPLLPMLIDDTYYGDYDLLLEEFLLAEDEEDYGRQRPEDADPVDDNSLADAQGMFYSVECFEEAPFADLDEVATLAESLDPLLAGILLEDVFQLFDACAIWLEDAAPALEADPVYSELPVLILAGEYDPVTPPSWARLAAETLPNHFYVELPRGGHALTDTGECMSEIILAFLADPIQEPDLDCIADEVRPFVVP
jgi:pimeloyl-ACP methyl ester carboxylesterase